MPANAWITEMFKPPKGPRLRARALEKEITKLAAKLGRPIVKGVIDRQSMSLIFQEGKLFIEPKDMQEAEFAGVNFVCVDRKLPEMPFFALYAPIV